MTKRALTARRAREAFRYDERTGHLFWRTGARKGKRADQAGWKRYRRVSIDGDRYLVHRVIWLMKTGDWPMRGEIDHRDGNGHNNAWANLREATRTENNYNTKTRADNQSGLKWVRSKGNGTFQATVQLCLGTFKTPEAAHQRAKTFVRAHHRQFFNAGARNA